MSPEGIIRLLVLAAAVALLEVLCRTGAISPMVMIPPSVMLTTLGDVLARPEMRQHILVTVADVALAAVLAVVAGFALGVALHAAPRLRHALDPLFASYYALPVFVFYPVLIVIFGVNSLPIIVIGFVYAVVAMVINTLNGIDRIPPVLIKVARVHRMSPWATALLVQLPAAAPFLLTGIKLAVAYAFIGVIASEFILATAGLGFSIAYAYNNFDNRTMYALIVLIVILVTTVNMTLHVWERRVQARLGRHGH